MALTWVTPACLAVAILGSQISLCAADWNNAQFEVIQDSPGLALSRKVSTGKEVLSPQWCGVEFCHTTGNVSYLAHGWCREHVILPDHTYLIKRHQKDEYDPPLYLYHNSINDEVIYLQTVPGLLSNDSTIQIRLTPHDPWYKFAVLFWDINSGLRPYKIKVWNSDKTIQFCWEDGSGTEYDTEIRVYTLAPFPFLSGEENTLTVVFKADAIQVTVNGDFLHSYAHRQNFRLVDTVSVWFEGVVDSLYLHSVDIWLPSLNNSVPLS